MDGRAKHLLESTVEESVTPETAMDAGLKIGQVYKSVTVIIDSDTSSLMIAHALMSGLMAAGARVTYAGNVSVPAAHVALSQVILSVGNPDVNGTISGIKAYNADGSPFSGDQLYDILKETDIQCPGYREVGRISEYGEANDIYIEKVKSLGCSSQGYIIVDCGCGSTSGCAPAMLAEIGADVVGLNTHPCKGHYPRAPGIRENDLLNTPNFVNASIGSIGIAFNGDGTRMALMDESGDYVPGDRLLALMLMYLEPTVAVVPFDSPRVVEDAFGNPLGINKKENTGERKLVRCKNDIHSVIAAMKANDADFGALNDGTFIFPEIGYCPDGLYATAVISGLAGKRSIRNILEDIPIYSNRTIKMDFDGNIRVFNTKLKERIKEYDISEVCTSNDEWKMILKNGTYTIKQSDIDPKKILVFAESSDRVYLITMLEQAKDIIGYCV